MTEEPARDFCHTLLLFPLHTWHGGLQQADFCKHTLFKKASENACEMKGPVVGWKYANDKKADNSLIISMFLRQRPKITRFSLSIWRHATASPPPRPPVDGGKASPRRRRETALTAAGHLPDGGNAPPRRRQDKSAPQTTRKPRDGAIVERHFHDVMIIYFL